MRISHRWGAGHNIMRCTAVFQVTQTLRMSLLESTLAPSQLRVFLSLLHLPCSCSLWPTHDAQAAWHSWGPCPCHQEHPSFLSDNCGEPPRTPPLSPRAGCPTRNLPTPSWLPFRCNTQQGRPTESQRMPPSADHFCISLCASSGWNFSPPLARRSVFTPNSSWASVR